MRGRALAATGAALTKALFLLALVGLLGSAALMAGALLDRPPTRPWWGLLLAAATYILSHIMRIARLALLSGDARLSLRSLAQTHLFTAGVSLITPFKLGEAYRMAELSILTGSPVRGVVLVWLERVFDVVVILALLIVASIWQPQAIASYAGVLGLSLLFVLATLVLVVLVPDNLRRIGSYIIRRYDQAWTVRILWLITELRGIISRMSQMLHGRQLSLLVFTIVIWTLEGLSFSLLVSEGQNLLRPFAGLLSFLSLTTEGETLTTFTQRRTDGAISESLFSYVVATQGTLLVVAIVAGLAMSRTRLANARPWKR